eukprot:scaffold185396_cov22-Tisochrysis_lutea.AAC.1
MMFIAEAEGALVESLLESSWSAQATWQPNACRQGDNSKVASLRSGTDCADCPRWEESRLHYNFTHIPLFAIWYFAYLQVRRSGTDCPDCSR